MTQRVFYLYELGVHFMGWIALEPGDIEAYKQWEPFVEAADTPKTLTITNGDQVYFGVSVKELKEED